MSVEERELHVCRQTRSSAAGAPASELRLTKKFLQHAIALGRPCYAKRIFTTDITDRHGWEKSGFISVPIGDISSSTSS